MTKLTEIFSVISKKILVHDWKMTEKINSAARSVCSHLKSILLLKITHGYFCF